METAPLKWFATWARTALIREVTARIAVALAPASPERVEKPKCIEDLEKAVKVAGGGDKGRAAVADKVAYTWFNRIIALRFMDANGYTGVGVVSPQVGVDAGQPEVLAEAKRGNIDAAVVGPKIRETVTALLNGSRRSDDAQGEAYALLLADYCRYWNSAMPFMFEREGDFTELLIPANLLADDSVPSRVGRVLTKDVCQDVEVIGWLYQFYISERKDEVFAGFKKNKKAGAEEIPAATQLFTPHWIVRYLVENSLGRLWMLNHPSSRVVDQMEYYIASVDKESDFLKINKPEELTVIDPACGSGHMLTYSFDLLYAIYEEEGYAPAEIPGLILANNLYGVEIDPRAGALAAFALTMKARARQRTFFSNQVEPNVCVLEPIRFTPDDLVDLVGCGGNRRAEVAFWCQFEQADLLGALVAPRAADVDARRDAIRGLAMSQLDVFDEDLRARAARLLYQAEFLAREYATVIANPPYMGSGNMGSTLVDLVKRAFPAEKQDLYACFVSRAYDLTRPRGLIAMIVGDTWMTIKRFETFRVKLLANGGMLTFLHLDDVSNHPDIFGANAAFVVERDGGRDIRCSFIRLEPLSGEDKRLRLKQAIADPETPWVYSVQSSIFATVPSAPIAYRMSSAVRAVFAKFPELSSIADSRQGLATSQDARFVRYWFEVSASATGQDMADREQAKASGRRWFPFNKGGAFRRWYGNIEHVVNWEGDGAEIKETIVRKYPYLKGNAEFVAKNPDYYFRPAVTWSNVSSGSSAFRAADEGVIFGHVGQGIFGHDATRDALLSTLNSTYGDHILGLISPTLHFEAGTIARIPINLDLDPVHRILVRKLVKVSRQDWDTQETSRTFSVPDWPPVPGKLIEMLSARFDYWNGETEKVLSLEEQNDRLVLSAYGLESELERKSIRSRVSLVNNPYFRFENTDSRSTARSLFLKSSVENLVSYAVGCMFGRYCLDEPGLILADQGATLQEYLAKVPTPSFEPDEDNVIPVVDGDWFEDDIVACFRTFLRAAFGEQFFEENLRFVTVSLGVKDIREYFIKTGTRSASSKFYDDHVQRYKKRPIYWLFSSPKGSFNALIYMHRYAPSTVSTVLNEYLREFTVKLSSSLRQQEHLAVGGSTPRQQAAAQKEADRLRKVLVELEEYEHDVLYPLASQQLAIDLDDGVKANYPKFGAALKRIQGLEASDE